MQAPELIKRAEAHAGSQYALAQTLGVDRGNLNKWRTGERPCPADIQARLADLIGLDPIDAALAAIAESLTDQRRAGLAETLKRAGRAVLPCIGGTMLTTALYLASSSPVQAASTSLCIM